MSSQDECYRDTKAWPVEHSRPVSAVKVWALMLKKMRFKMREDGQDGDDIVDVAWVLREREMDQVQRLRDAYVAQYRPIQTLDGLDPHPSRVAIRKAAAALYALVHHG